MAKEPASGGGGPDGGDAVSRVTEHGIDGEDERRRETAEGWGYKNN